MNDVSWAGPMQRLKIAEGSASQAAEARQWLQAITLLGTVIDEANRAIVQINLEAEREERLREFTNRTEA